MNEIFGMPGMKRKADTRQYPNDRYKKRRTMTTKRQTKAQIYNRVKNSRALKWYDLTGTTTVSAAGGMFLNAFSGITAGVGTSQYTGNVLKLISWTFRFNIAGADPYNTFRLTLGQWTSSATPSLALLFQTPTNPLSPFEANHLDNMIIHKDMVTATGQQIAGQLSGGQLERNSGKWYIPARKLCNINFQAGTLADGWPFIAALSDSLLTPHCEIQWYSRVVYDDTF